MFLTGAVSAQDFDKDVAARFKAFQESAFKEFNDFKESAMKEYIDFVRKSWKEFTADSPIEIPKDTIMPVFMPDEEREKPIDSKYVQIKEVVKSVPNVRRKEPVLKIEEVEQSLDKYVQFTFYGARVKVRFDVADKVALSAVDENSIADALKTMSGKAYNNMLLDCMRLKRGLDLSDWAYIQLIDSLANSVYANDANGASLLTAYIYMNSGYKMRLASGNGRLYMLYASEHVIYEQNSFMIDGERYYGTKELPIRLNICSASFKGEEPLSLVITGNQRFALNISEPRQISSVKYPDFNVSVRVNRNLLDFYSTYPTSMIGDNMLTRWAMYANTPFDISVANVLYPALSMKLKGMSQLEAVEHLLNLVQTGFKYEYDDKVWGSDRIFFADECLFYPYNDCDDRSVLFSRLVRDLLGLDVVLVVVPGHILAAVNFTQEVDGNYTMFNDRKFVLCEPTCTNGAPVGWANIKEGASLSVIMLERDRNMKSMVIQISLSNVPDR